LQEQAPAGVCFHFRVPACGGPHICSQRLATAPAHTA
jgi:hypothetical protein